MIALFNAVNTLTFESGRVAWMIARTDIVIQKRVLSIVLDFVDIIANRLDKGLYATDEEYDFCLVAKRAQDSMAPFRENGML